MSDGQKRACVTYAKKMLKISSNFDKNKFANAFTGDEPGFNFMNHGEKLEIKWASSRENLSSGFCEQHRRRPACASAQSDQRLCCLRFETYHM